MENTHEEFCTRVGTPAKYSFEESMISSIQSKMKACIDYLKQIEAHMKLENQDITTREESLLQISNSLAELKRFL